MATAYERSYSFTLRGENVLDETIHSALFEEQDAETILSTLRDRLRVIPFSDYLKRYVYLKAGLFGSYQQIPLKEYQSIIQDAFQESGTPSSMNRNTTRLSGVVKNWLTQSTVRRGIVLLLGFGLSMSVQDVNDFLTKALHDRRLDDEDPLEAISLYCFDHHYRYPKMEQLRKIYQQSESGTFDVSLVEANQPAGRMASRIVASEDAALLRRLLERKSAEQTTLQAKTRLYFNRLYEQVLETIRRLRPQGTEDLKVQPHDVEETLCASIPRNHHGNLVPGLNSCLRQILAGKRISRQRLYDLLHRYAEPSRYDLITLRFFLCATETDPVTEPKKRMRLFAEEMNHILDECGFGPVYLADPYECFILMCLLSVDPLGTYSDVLELSYIPADSKPDEAIGRIKP